MWHSIINNTAEGLYLIESTKPVIKINVLIDDLTALESNILKLLVICNILTIIVSC